MGLREWLYDRDHGLGASKLPNRSPDRCWAGTSSGASCVICGQLVKADEIEFELEFATADDGNVPENHHVHRGCFLTWDSERREREREWRQRTVAASELSGAIGETRLTTDEREGAT